MSSVPCMHCETRDGATRYCRRPATVGFYCEEHTERSTEMKTYISYRRTFSKNYQSITSEFGMEVVIDGDAGKGTRARELCRAIVNHELGQKIGKTRSQLNKLAVEFFGVDWNELTTGVAEEDVLI